MYYQNETMPVFTYEDIEQSDSGLWCFERSMIGTCAAYGLFEDCDGNGDVEDKLIDTSVIDEQMHPDSEYCSLNVWFTRLEDGCRFIDRLNRFIKNRGL